MAAYPQSRTRRETKSHTLKKTDFKERFLLWLSPALQLAVAEDAGMRWRLR